MPPLNAVMDVILHFSPAETVAFRLTEHSCHSAARPIARSRPIPYIPTEFDIVEEAKEALEEARRVADESLAEARQALEVIDAALKKYPEARQKAYEKRRETARTTILDGEKSLDAGD